jgi:hypothetical protein
MTPVEGSNLWGVVRSFSAMASGSRDGLFQTVPTVPGTPYRLTVAVQAHNRFRPNEPDPNNRFVYVPGAAADTGDTDVRVGVDLSGGTNPDGAGVTFGGFRTTGAMFADETLEFTATGPATTIFLDSSQLFALDGHWSGFDNVRLAIVPEPAGFLAVGLAGLVCLGARRRR